MPIDEYGISTSIKNKHFLSQNEKLVLLPEFDIFNLANNKGLLSKHLTFHNIPASETILFAKNEICNESPISFPVIMKPLEGFFFFVFYFNKFSIYVKDSA